MCRLPLHFLVLASWIMSTSGLVAATVRFRATRRFVQERTPLAFVALRMLKVATRTASAAGPSVGPTAGTTAGAADGTTACVLAPVPASNAVAVAPATARARQLRCISSTPSSWTTTTGGGTGQVVGTPCRRS